MPRSPRSVLRSLLVSSVLLGGLPACFELDITGPDTGSGSGCFLCYPEQGPIVTPSFDSIPVAVSGGLTFSAISVGATHVCAISTAGGAWCWGSRGVGTASYLQLASPLLTPGSEGLRHITVGDLLTCGLAASGLASCWGVNGFGQLGTGAPGAPVLSPTAVHGGVAFTTLSTSGASSYGGAHTCGLTPAGAAYCWGGNQYGQLGNGGLVASAAPLAVAGGHSFGAISVGAKFVCAIVRGDGTWCWGGATEGQLGRDPGTAGNCAQIGSGAQLACSTTPVRIAGSERFVTLSSGGAHACALDADGIASCWGNNLYGQLGTGNQRWSFTPALVNTAMRFAQIRAGADATCALTRAGAAYCWGANHSGQVGDGTTLLRTLPRKVATELTFTAISVGSQEVCALTASGAASCWGSNEGGKLGKGS